MGLWGKVRDKVVPGKRRRTDAPDAPRVPGPVAAARRGPAGPGAMPPDALAAAEQRSKLPALGIDPSLLQHREGGPVPPPQEAVADADQEVDDRLARLARLGRLRESGELTPDQFEEQRRRILDA